MNIIDLFCGCGGLSYGFEQAGFNVLLGIDNNKTALETFKKNHKNSQVFCGDITKVSLETINNIIGNKEIHLIVGGPPCQGMSLSGPRKLHDPRNKLYLSFIRLVSEIKPLGFIIENVPGLVKLFNGAIKNAILEEFTKLGYNVKYEILNSADYGVPQNRKRVIFIGFRNLTPKFPSPTTLFTPITCENAISDLPPLINDLGEEKVSYSGQANCEYQKMMRKDSDGIYNHIAANHSLHVKEIIAQVPEGGNYKDLPSELQQTRNFHVAWTRFDRRKPAPTIDTGHRHHFHYQYNRVPTVRECARIQSFPDKFIFLGNKTEQFKQVGNAVPPILAYSIAQELKIIMETKV